MVPIDPFFFEIHSQLDREGPGSFADTERALSYVGPLSSSSRILDIASGPGAQTLDLARLTLGKIESVDRHEPFVKCLQNSVRELGLHDRVNPSLGDMRSLKFAPGTFDLIWCEGALYIMGFEAGLREWHKLLKPGGYLAITEPVWLKESPLASVVANWQEYPQMTTVPGNIAKIRGCGYELSGHFTLSSQAWENYYGPLEKRALLLMQKFGDQPAKRALIEETLSESSVYRHYGEYFGYEFFIMRALPGR